VQFQARREKKGVHYNKCSALLLCDIAEVEERSKAGALAAQAVVVLPIAQIYWNVLQVLENDENSMVRYVPSFLPSFLQHQSCVIDVVPCTHA